MIQIKFIKDGGGKQIGDVVNCSKKSAESAINQGYAEYVDKSVNKKEIKEQVIFIKDFLKNKEGDVIKYNKKDINELVKAGAVRYYIDEDKQYETIQKKILEIIDYDIIRLDKEIDVFSKKYNIRKGSIKNVLKEEQSKLKEKENEKKLKDKYIIKEKEKELKDKEKCDNKKEKELKKLKIEEEKDKKKKDIEYKKEKEQEKKELEKLQKEKTRDELKSKIEAEREINKLKLEELEEGWETCSDELFVELIDKDFKKAQHYFTQRLMHDHYFKVFEDNQDILVYCDKGDKEGEYLQDGDKLIQTMCENRLGEKATIFVVKEIISKIQRTDKLKISRESIFNNDKDIIAVKNGILNMKTKELSSFTPEKVFLSKSNAKFIPGVDAKLWLNFLNTSLPNKENEIKTIQEMAGYTLSNDNSRQKGFISYGAGATGQSTMQEVLAYLIGEENITNLSIQDIEHDAFAPAMLFGKKANMNPDLPKKALGESSRIKKIIRGEKLYVQKKGKDGYSMRPTVKLWNGCNQIPSTEDQSDGFFRSWIPVKFEEQFLEGDPRRIEDLSSKICLSQDEMSGILNWCVEGYNRLEKNNHFSICFTIQEIKDFWLEHSDTVSSYYKNVIKMDISGKVIKQDVYDNYVEYCEMKNKPAEEQNIFFGRLKNICEYKEFTPSSLANDRRRRLLGVSLLPLNNDMTQPTQVSLDQRP